jgi:phosphatidylglycerol lysyltransferase
VIRKLSQRKYLLLWQLSLLLTGTSWLWAPRLNSSLSYRTSLISQYEAPHQAFSWLFRSGDVLAGGLVMLISIFLLKIKAEKVYGWLLFAISVGLIFDPLFSTTCRMVGQACQEYFSFNFLIHAIETVATSILIFAAAVYDNYKRKKIVSLAFIIFQIAYGGLFLSQLADQDHFNTFSQYIYQTSLIVWLAWLGRELLAEKNFMASDLEGRTVRNLSAGWAYLNGILAIVVSLAHVNLLGRIKGLYFSGDNAWLAQHGIIVGVVMIYLARHLARGEARARQIFLLLSGIETLKYAVVSPHAGLMVFYFITFAALFVLRDDFNRGTIPLTWIIRIKDLAFLVSGLLISAFITLVLLDRDSRVSIITSQAADNFTDYVFKDTKFPHAHLNSVLLVHSASVFLAASLFAVLWVLFRPYKPWPRQAKDYAKAEQLLGKYSGSSEDFFKLWPTDKDYFWNSQKTGFIAYKVVNATAFVLADPIGPSPKKLLADFNDWCRERRLKICCLPVYPNALELYKSGGLEILQIGSSAVIDIQEFLTKTIKDKWWRWRINKAQRSGYTYGISTPPHSSRLMKEMQQKCTVHYLHDSRGRLAAFTNELPQFKKRDLLTVDLFRSDPASESMAYLLYKVIEHAGQNGYARFDLGFVPFAKAKGPLLLIAKNISADKFSAKGLEQFKSKFNPKWEPNYLAYEGDIADLGLIALNIEKAMDPV